MIEAIKIEGVSEQISARLRGEIMSGRLSPGEPLREESLAAKFGVSRMPIRHVLHQLVHEGLLVAKPNCGVTVAQPASQEIRELLMPIRVMIETYAIKRSVAELSEDDFRDCERMLNRLRLVCEEGDHDATLRLDFEFHEWLLRRAGLEEVIPLWRQVLHRTELFYEHTQIAPEDLPVVHAVHVELVKVFRSGNQRAAVTALTEHILNGEFNRRVHRRWRRQRKVRK